MKSSEAPSRLITVALAASGVAAGHVTAIVLSDEQRLLAVAACTFAALAAMLWSVALAFARRRSRAGPKRAPRETAAAPSPAPVRHLTPEDVLIPIEGGVIDETVLDSLRKLGGESFVAEVVSQFISEGVLCLLKVAQAIGEGDVDEYAAQIHALRSSAANVGARRLYKLCLEWRALSGEDLEATGSARFVLLQKEFAAAEAILKGRKRAPAPMAGAAEAG